MTIRPIIAWYDMWVGMYWDRRLRRLYVLPLPCIGFVVQVWQLDRSEISRVMAERDAAIRERDDARRDVVRSVTSSLADDSCRRDEANERWPGSGEVLFPPEIGES